MASGFSEIHMTNDTYQTSIFFGWWAVLVTGIISGLGMGFYVYGISALFKPIALDLGLTLVVLLLMVVEDAEQRSFIAEHYQ
jgi:hypothetical protein